MKKFLRKYWLFLIVCVIWGITDFYWMPRQKNSYAPWEIALFSKKAALTLLILEAIVLCVFLLYFIVRRWPLRPASTAFAVATFMLGFVYLTCRDSVAAAGLYVNQWGTHETVSQSYVAQYFNNERTESSFSLIDVGANQRLREGDLVKAAYGVGVAPGDTVYADLKKGLLNVAYFDGGAVRKK